MNENKRQWTPEQRARQAQRIRRCQPWLSSTGPKTVEGKRNSSRNAYQPCLHTPEINAIQGYLEASRLLLKALARKRRQAHEKQRAERRLARQKVLHIVGDAPWLAVKPSSPVIGAGKRPKARSVHVSSHRISPEVLVADFNVKQ